jgi:hypothetical protein
VGSISKQSHNYALSVKMGHKLELGFEKNYLSGIQLIVFQMKIIITKSLRKLTNETILCIEIYLYLLCDESEPPVGTAIRTTKYVPKFPNFQ